MYSNLLSHSNENDHKMSAPVGTISHRLVPSARNISDSCVTYLDHTPEHHTGLSQGLPRILQEMIHLHAGASSLPPTHNYMSKNCDVLSNPFVMVGTSYSHPNTTDYARSRSSAKISCAGIIEMDYAKANANARGSSSQSYDRQLGVSTTAI